MLHLAEREGYEIPVTTDRSLRYQQNPGRRHIGIVVLLSANRPGIRSHGQEIGQTISAARPARSSRCPFRRNDLAACTNGQGCPLLIPVTLPENPFGPLGISIRDNTPDPEIRNPGTPCSCPVPAPPSSAGISFSYSVSSFSCFFPRHPGGRTACWNPPGLHMTGQVAAIRNDCWAVPHGTERAANRSAAGGSSMQGFAAEYAAGDTGSQGCYPWGHESRSAESGLPQYIPLPHRRTVDYPGE